MCVGASRRGGFGVESGRVRFVGDDFYGRGGTDRSDNPGVVLIVAVEARALGTAISGISWSAPSRHMRWKMLATIVAVSLTAGTEGTCIWSVSSGQALGPLPGFAVTIGLLAIGSVCFFTVLKSDHRDVCWARAIAERRAS